MRFDAKPAIVTGGPREMAGLCSFLASDDASFVTAAVIPVDGGAAAVDVSGAAIDQMAAEHSRAAQGTP